VKKPSGDWGVKVLKQKIQVDGLTYELQEIYGIDGSVASAQPKHDGADGELMPGAIKDELDMPDGAECIICMSEPRNTTVLPCRHMCLCGECAEMLRKNSSTCPICRTRVESLLQIRVGGTKDTCDDDDDFKE
jgi:E3 ubiquitin-protein ligase MGRN1